MASKKRAGLSKREYAAAQAAKVKTPAKKTVAKNIGPVASGEAYAKSLGKPSSMIGPVADGAAYARMIESPETSRQKAAKAKSSSNSKTKYQHPTISGASVANPFGLDTAESEPTPKKGGIKGLFSELFSSMGRQAGKNSLGRATDNIFLTDEDRSQNRRDLAGIPTSLAQEDFSPLSEQERTALDQEYGMESVVDSNSGNEPWDSRESLYEDKSDKPRGGLSQRELSLMEHGYQLNRPGDRDVALSSQAQEIRSNSPAGKNDKKYAPRPGVDYYPEAAPEMSFEQQQNDLYDGGPGPEQTPGNTIGNRSGRGSGMFGNGAGIQGEDPYLKEMRKSMKGYGSQENDIRKQFERLIKSLDPTYDEYKRQGEEDLNRNLMDQNTRLAAVMNANNTGDSEQRAQLLAGQQRGMQTELADLVRKLMLQKNQDIEGYKTKSVDAVSNVRDKAAQARLNYSKLLSDYQKEQASANQYSAPKSYGTQIDKIMEQYGVDNVTARKIAERDLGLTTPKNPVPSGEFRTDPQDGKLKQLYIVDGQLGFLD